MTRNFFPFDFITCSLAQQIEIRVENSKPHTKCFPSHFADVRTHCDGYGTSKSLSPVFASNVQQQFATLLGNSKYASVFAVTDNIETFSCERHCDINQNKRVEKGRLLTLTMFLCL